MLLALCALLYADTYDMNDAGIVLDLPKGWASQRWADWEFRGTSPDGAVALMVWYDAFQPTVDEATVASWAARYRVKIEGEKGKNVRMESATVIDVGSRPTGKVEMRFNFDRVGAKGVMYASGFAGEGKTLHVATYSTADAATKAENALAMVLDRLKLTKPPVALPEGPLEGPPGVKLVLPAGWRGFLAGKEAEAVGPLLSLAGEVDPALCARAAKPAPDGTASVLVLCRREWQLGILDEASASDVEKKVRMLLYGKAADKVPAGVTVELSDRLAIAITPEANKYDLRAMVVPYDQGWLVGTAVGESGAGSELDAALRASFASLQYSGPDNGKPAWSTGQTAVHLISYQPWHPAVLGPVALILGALALLARVVFRKAPAPPELHS